MPDNLLPNLSNHDLFGASSISLTRSAKYVGWLFGSSNRPLSLNCPNISFRHCFLWYDIAAHVLDRYIGP
jgi:hypothetical protein